MQVLRFCFFGMAVLYVLQVISPLSNYCFLSTLQDVRVRWLGFYKPEGEEQIGISP